MRLLRLDLERFGHFRDRSIAFGSGSDVKRSCIVRGANEAGKTTALAAIQCLLFGFPAQASKYAVGFEQSQLAVGALVELQSGGKHVELRRTKGRGPTLHGTIVEGGDEIDEDWLHGKLGRPTRGVFENVFGFSIDVLAQGAESLKHDRVREALYGVAVGGGVRPDKLLEELREEREKLFVPQGRQRRINERQDELKKLRATVNERTTRVAEVDAIEAEARERRARAKEKQEGAARARAEAARRKALLDGLEPFRERALAKEELTTIRAPSLPVESIRRHAQLVADRQRVARELDAHRAAAAELEAQLAGTKLDPHALDGAEAIDALAASLEAHRAELRELPLVAARLETSTRTTRARLAELRPRWDLSRLRGVRLDAATIADLQERAAKHEEIVRDTRAAEDEIARCDASLREIDAELAALPPSVGDDDCALISRWIEGWSGFVAARESIEALEVERAAATRKRSTKRRALDPPLAADRDVAALVVPRAEEVELHLSRMIEAEARGAKLEAQIAEREERIAAVRADLAEIDAAERAPTDEELSAARERRARGWRLVARTLKNEPIGDEARAFDEQPLPVAFERAMLAADDVADRMLRQSAVVQRRAIKRASLETSLSELETTRGKLVEARVSMARLDEEWRAAWERCAFAPLAPRAMLQWLADRDAVLELDARSADLDEQRRRWADRNQAWISEGMRLLGETSGDVERLRARAQSVVAAHRARRLKEGSLLDRRALDGPASERARDRLLRLRERASAWLEGWRAAARGTGVLDDDDERTSERFVTTLVSEVHALRRALDAEDELRAEHDRRRATIAEWTTRVDEVRRAHAADLPKDDPLFVVESMRGRVHAAREAKRAAEERERALEGERRRCERSAQAMIEIDHALAESRAAAGAEDDDAFRAIAADVERAEKLRQIVNEATRTLRRLRGAWGEEEYVEALAASDADALSLEVDRLQREATALHEDEIALERELGALGERRRAIGTASAAADAASEAAGVRAALRDDVERWATLTVAEELLRAGVARFEREHQPELLATASRLLSIMTLGRWKKVQRPLGGGLRIVRADGEELGPDALSTGTREQLYLAIRLAYVEHYGKKVEPLPVILDDVLVDFDPERTVATLRALADFAAQVQVVLFTCHDHVVDLAQRSEIDVVTLTL